MRGTAIVLVCLISLHYLSVIDAYSVRFTSENGMLGGRHEDRYPRRSTQIKRSLSESMFRDMEIANETSEALQYEDDDDDDFFPPHAEEEIKERIKKILAVIGKALAHLLEKWAKEQPDEAVVVYGEEDKNRNFLRIANLDKETIVNYLSSLKNTGSKSLDIASDVIDGIDVSNLEQKEKDLKKHTVGMLKTVKNALKEIAESAARKVGSNNNGVSPKRRIRSVRRRTSNRDALEAYLTSLKSQRRSKLRKTLLASKRRNTPVKRSDAVVLPPDFIPKMDDCMRKMFSEDASNIELRCVLLPFMKLLGSWGKGNANDSPIDTDSNVRSNKFRSHDNGTRKLNLPWGNIFLIPIYDKYPPIENITTTTAPPPTVDGDSKSDNETTTTLEPTTTSTPESTTTPIPTTTKSTTEASQDYKWPGDYNYGSLVPPVEDPDDSRYRSRYDSNY